MKSNLNSILTKAELITSGFGSAAQMTALTAFGYGKMITGSAKISRQMIVGTGSRSKISTWRLVIIPSG